MQEDVTIEEQFIGDILKVFYESQRKKSQELDSTETQPSTVTGQCIRL